MSIVTHWIALILMCAIVRALSEPSYAYAHQIQERCDTEIRLGLNDSFALGSFPPQSPSSIGYYGAHGNGFYGPGPRECTLSFKAVGDCSLTWRTTHYDYERGHIDCSEEYLLIGDENKEKRICGLGRPARDFNSSGQFLFLTHYQRNGYSHGMVAAVLGGIVRCEKKEQTGPPPCGPWTDFVCGFIGGGTCPGTGSCAANASMTTLTTPALTEFVSGMCPVAHCEGLALGLCTAGTNVTCDGPLPTPTFNGTTPGQCFSAKAACPTTDPRCHMQWTYASSLLSPNGGTFECSSPPETRCMAAVVFCFNFPK